MATHLPERSRLGLLTVSVPVIERRVHEVLGIHDHWAVKLVVKPPKCGPIDPLAKTPYRAVERAIDRFGRVAVAAVDRLARPEHETSVSGRGIDDLFRIGFRIALTVKREPERTPVDLLDERERLGIEKIRGNDRMIVAWNFGIYFHAWLLMSLL